MDRGETEGGFPPSLFACPLEWERDNTRSNTSIRVIQQYFCASEICISCAKCADKHPVGSSMRVKDAHIKEKDKC